MSGCIVPFCSFDYRTKMKKILAPSFHAFPKEESRRQAWILAIRAGTGQENWTPGPRRDGLRLSVCTSHFREKDVDRSSLAMVRLRPHAVPSIFTRPRQPAVNGDKAAPGLRDAADLKGSETSPMEAEDQQNMTKVSENVESQKQKETAASEDFGDWSDDDIDERQKCEEPRPFRAGLGDDSRVEDVSEEEEAMGRVIANKLKRMNEAQRKKAEALICRILFAGLRGKLTSWTNLSGIDG